MAKLTTIFSNVLNNRNYYARIYPVNPQGSMQSELDGQITINAIIPASFPAEPSSYSLIDTYTSSTTFTAPEDGWYQVELFGRSGAGGTAAAFVDTSYNTRYLHTVGAGGGGGGGAYCCTNKIKLNKGDTISIVIGTTCTATITASTDTSYSVMKCTTGSNGGNGTASGSGSYRGDGGAGGVATGGTVNQNGSAGEFGSYENAYDASYITANGGAGGASGHTSGNVGGVGGTSYITGTSNKYIEAAGSAKAGFCKIYRGNTNIIG